MGGKGNWPGIKRGECDLALGSHNLNYVATVISAETPCAGSLHAGCKPESSGNNVLSLVLPCLVCSQALDFNNWTKRVIEKVQHVRRQIHKPSSATNCRI